MDKVEKYFNFYKMASVVMATKIEKLNKKEKNAIALGLATFSTAFFKLVFNKEEMKNFMKLVKKG